MNAENSCNSNLLRLLPAVLRAREFHLYLEDGRRLTDLWQIGGKAVLGHKPPRIVSELKNAAERGLFAPFPHPAEQRFLKALTKLFINDENCSYSFRIYENKPSLERALEKANLSILLNEEIAVWRPFSGKKNPSSQLSTPVLPWAFSPAVLAIQTNGNSLNEKIPPGDLLSPAILAPATRAVYDLLAAGEHDGRPRYPRIEKALAKSAWSRSGIYLTNPEAGADWPVIWNRFLEQGFLLPPCPAEPLILPGILSPGEEAKLAELLTVKNFQPVQSDFKI